jgi:Uroporphyrinogen decarboxylase (URO-D)
LDRAFYLELAAQGLRMPIGTDLVLNEEREPEKVRLDGVALGRVIALSARRWKTPLAIPLMDLRLEKADLLARFGVAADQSEAFHFTAPLDNAFVSRGCCDQNAEPGPGSRARNEAVSYIHSQEDIVAVGMTIGPFSLATRLMADPITVAAMAGRGTSTSESDEVLLLHQCLELAEAAVRRSVMSQIAHGARAIMICEPAASKAYLSPRQIRSGSQIFEKLVMAPNLRVKELLDSANCDFFFHDCGELTDEMVEKFATRLHPVILSLGSSRKLWEDARLVPRDVVLYGNLPTKSFYSDSVMPVAKVIEQTRELRAKMAECGHPHILGSECDVLFVAEAKTSIHAKVAAMMDDDADPEIHLRRFREEQCA